MSETFREQLKQLEREMFEKLDWSKSNPVLAGETGLPYQTVAKWRVILGHPKATKLYPACLSWDWTLSDTQLSRVTGISLAYIGRLRLRCGKAPIGRTHPTRSALFTKPVPRKMPTDWNAIDWVKPDILIADETGFTREYVRQQRNMLNKPESPCKGGVKFYDFYVRFNGRAEMTYEEVRGVLPVSEPTFRKYCAQLDIRVIQPERDKRCLYPYDLMNFNLPNILLEKIWRIPYGSVVPNHRSRHNKRYAKFYCLKGYVPPEFRAMVADEERKAAEWFAKHPISNGKHAA